jgi:predicted PurR-regulated permease PerM
VSLVAGAVLALLYVLWLLGTTPLVIFSGVLFAIILHGLSSWLSRRTGMRRRWALAVVVTTLVAAAAAAVVLTGPSAARQAEELRKRLPRVVRPLRAKIERHELGRDLLGSNGQQQPGAVAERAGRAFGTALGLVADALIVFFLGVFLAAEPDLYRRGVLSLVPQRSRGRAREALDAAGETLKWWLLGRAFTMVVIGALTTVGLLVLGAPMAVPMGVLAGLLNFVPYVGPVIAGIPAVALALTEGVRPALHVTALYVFVQSLEGYVLTPLVDRRTVSIPPALGLSAQLVFGVLLGAAGVMLASPLVVCALVARDRLAPSSAGSA